MVARVRIGGRITSVVVVFVSFNSFLRQTNGLGKNGWRNVLGTCEDVGEKTDGGRRGGGLLRSRLGFSCWLHGVCKKRKLSAR